MRSPDALTELFRGQGLKITPQRQCIFRALDGDEGHPSAEAIYETVRSTMPSISLRTVYQTLNDLVAMGEISTIDIGTGSTRFDPNTADHHHLVCDTCGAVTDVQVDLEGSGIDRAATREYFEVARTEIVFRGRCARCRERSADRPT